MQEATWTRLDVSDWSVQGVEQEGSTRTQWLEDPNSGQPWLHKDTLTPSNGVEQGEDWSEVLSTHVAKLLGAPCAETRLCLRHGHRGSLSLSVVPEHHHMWEGNVYLQAAGLPDYFPHVEGEPGVDPAHPGVKRPGHSLVNIRAALEGVAAPPEFEGAGELSGFDVFAGYMILDALIANRDRHEQNWAVLSPQLLSSTERLAPSYDHASSLGYNLPDTKRRGCLEDSIRLRTWAERGTAYRFEHVGKSPTLTSHAANAVALCSSAGADWWRGRLVDTDLEPVLAPLRERAVPGMSDLAAKFAHELLDLNLRRLRDVVTNRD